MEQAKTIQREAFRWFAADAVDNAANHVVVFENPNFWFWKLLI